MLMSVVSNTGIVARQIVQRPIPAFNPMRTMKGAQQRITFYNAEDGDSMAFMNSASGSLPTAACRTTTFNTATFTQYVSIFTTVPNFGSQGGHTMIFNENAISGFWTLCYRPNGGQLMQNIVLVLYAVLIVFGPNEKYNKFR